MNTLKDLFSVFKGMTHADNPSKPVSIVIIGAGDRGTTYASYALENPSMAKVVGVAEPQTFRRERLVKEHKIPEKNVFADWSDLAKQSQLADAAVIATQDSMHRDPAIALARKGYHLLLEKPMAPDERSCREIVSAVKSSGVMMAVCHVLRYTAYTKKLKELIDSGAIGEVISIQRLEPVGYWHQAHSFVRGNWRREDESSFMLLAKSCHDLDWIRHIIGRRCTAVSSFGSLTHFHEGNRPEDSSTRCLQCDYEPDCPYSAKRIYLRFLERGVTGWPVTVVTPDVSEKGILAALDEGSYGQCVYRCDNDVVDHQVVNMEFEGGQTASFTMMAFTKARPRETRIFGTQGEIFGDGEKIRVHDFLTESEKTYDTSTEGLSSLEAHGGGDFGVIDSFVRAVAYNNPSLILSGPDESLETHLMVFSAERSRKEKRTISI
jgi:predicted dehydrogenase